MPKHRATHSRRLGSPLVLLTLATGATACAGDTIDLGDNASPLQAHASSCQGSPTLAGPVLIENQTELDRLAGCETIEGDLLVAPFENPDFRALASLVSVTGSLELGNFTFVLQSEEDFAYYQRLSALVQAGWIETLDGLQALERAGSLTLDGVGAPSLEPLSNLRALTGGGTLDISGCTELRDLSGLEGVTGLVDLNLVCRSLESLDGLSFPSTLRDVFIDGEQLTDLGAFDVTRVNEIVFRGTGLTNLDALSSLELARRVSLFGNPALRDVEGLDNLRELDELRVRDNPVLERLPDFRSIRALSFFLIQGNAALRQLPSFPDILNDFEGLASLIEISPRDLRVYSPDVVEIDDNPALEEFTVPAGWQSAGYLAIENNASLSRVAFSSIRAADLLSIENNPALTTVDLGALATADTLRVINNPALQLATFDPIESFQSILSSGPTDPEAP